MVSAIILAAGESKRMGKQNKLLLPFRGRTMIERIVDTVLSSNVSEVIVVLGYEAKRVRAVLQHLPVKFVVNENYQQGMTTSIHCGVKAARDRTDGFLICLADMPLIEDKDFNHLLDAFEQKLPTQNKLIIIPFFKEKRGNPVIFSALYKDDILAHQEMGGCKGIIKNNLESILEVKMARDNILKDIDTIKDYNRIIDTQR